jgi:hypothetical protein
MSIPNGDILWEAEIQFYLKETVGVVNCVNLYVCYFHHGVPLRKPIHPGPFAPSSDKEDILLRGRQCRDKAVCLDQS